MSIPNENTESGKYCRIVSCATKNLQRSAQTCKLRRSGSQTRRASPLAGASWTAGVQSFTGLHLPVFSLIAVGRSGWQYFAAMLLSSFRSHAWCRFCVCLRLLQGRCKLCSQCICVTWSQRSRRLARVPETLQKLLAVGHQSDASAHWGVGLAAGRSLCAVSVGLHCSFVDSMARQRASRGERVAETSQPGGSRGVCPNFLGGWQCIAYDLDFCMHVSACFCVGTASWLAFGVFCSRVLFACFAS